MRIARHYSPRHQAGEHLLTGETDIKISDFGAALTIAAETTQVSGIGSPAYMSPEQLQELTLNHQTDIFSLGVVMYQLLTGALPFKATNNYSMVYQIIHVDVPPASMLRPEIPAAVDAIVRRALEKEITKRFRPGKNCPGTRRHFQTFRNRKKLSGDGKVHTLRRLEFFRTFSDVDLWQVLRISNWRATPQKVRYQGRRCRYRVLRHRRRRG